MPGLITKGKWGDYYRQGEGVDWGHNEAQVVEKKHHCRRSGWRQGPSKALRLRRTDYSLKGLGAIVPVCAKEISRMPMENICLALYCFVTTML